MSSFVEAVAAAGITYRQGQYWASQGWITGEPLAVGSGYHYRGLSEPEVRRLTVMAGLVKIGVKPPAAAQLAAKVEFAGGELHLILAPNVYLTVTAPPSPATRELPTLDSP